ncbi:hypothetical protein C8Q80DRAFT_1103489 [Daedaleopsis nitida]|nr:hypothetical protein C8Q80DRAFT_1103489 [Daedaleopsis nitida]
MQPRSPSPTWSPARSLGPASAQLPRAEINESSDENDESTAGTFPSLPDFTLTGDDHTLCPAMGEHPSIRLIYLQVVLSNVFEAATVDASDLRLCDTLDALDGWGDIPLPVYPKPARTLVTARRRLGLNVDDFIEKRPICTSCFKFYSPGDILKLDSPACIVPRCSGVLYRLKRDVDGVEKRIPAKIQPYAPLIKALQRFFLRPDFVKHFRLPSERPGQDSLADDAYMHDFDNGAIYGTYPLDLERIRLPDGSIADVKIRRGPQRTLMSVDIGVSLTINVDWFGTKKGRPHSTGGLYITFNTLDRPVRYLQHNVHLVMNIPGPKEPSLEQMNHMIEPLYNELKTLYGGILLGVHGRDTAAELFGAVEMRVCDLPGSRKLEGFAGHNHKKNPCFFCHIEHSDINDPVGYDTDAFVLRDDWVQIMAAYNSRDATSKKAKEDIFKAHGQRWSKLFELPGWKPSGCAIDYMHNVYRERHIFSGIILLPSLSIFAVGIAKDMFSTLLVKGYLLDKNMWQRLESLVNAIRWPSGIGRLPTNAKNPSFGKADQWRRWINIQSTVLWVVWRDHDDRIRPVPPEVPSNAAAIPTFMRDLRQIYDLFLYASVAEKVLANKKISMEEVRRGHSYLQRCCQAMLRLGIRLLPNHHLAMHYPEIFRLFGPVYAWWLYAHERFNGLQENVNHNGKGDGECYEHRLPGYSFSFPRLPRLGNLPFLNILLFYLLRSHAIVPHTLLFASYIEIMAATWRLSFDLLSPGEPHCTSLVDTHSIQSCLQP